jgi:hypothetical protein
MAASKGHQSIKHAIISKDSTTTVAAVGIAVFVIIFCLFSVRALIGQGSFHRRVIKEKEATLAQLDKNKKAVDNLRSVYTAFIGEPINVLGGSSTGAGPVDGNNAKLIIDALPGKYDFPALSSSIEKILKDGGYDIGSIGGSDTGSASQSSSNSTTTVSNTTTGGTVEMPYSFAVNTSQEGAKALLETLERSIRPMSVRSVSLQSGGNGLRVSINLKTFYATEKKFELTSKEVK